MGYTERKMKKKTRLERLEVYISRLTQFNSNAMHEVGKLAAALRYYADGSVWGGEVVGGEEGTTQGRNVTVWKPKEDGPSVARSVLNSLGLPWDQFPKSEDGTPVDPQKLDTQSVLKSIGKEMKAEEAGLAEDDKSQYGRYPGAEEEDRKYEGEQAQLKKAQLADLGALKESEHGPEHVVLEVKLNKGEIEHKADDGIPPEEK